MRQAKVILDRDYRIGQVDRRLYGSFLEHLGRAIYTGIYEPGHPTADAEGFRQDVLRLVRQLGIPLVRWPGGNFVSGYRWEDGIGPKAQRPRRPEMAWFSTESNEVGLHEFCSWARKADAQVMMAVNLGTRGADEARDLLEYCNMNTDTYFANLRRKNGAPEPFGIKVWCLGNEMDGPWQIGHKTANEYARVAHEAGKLMKWLDPSIELVACGSSNLNMSTFGTWEETVLDECGDTIDYLSLHQYYSNADGNTPNFLAQSLHMEQFIKGVTAMCDAVQARKHQKKQINLSFDEWNVWYHSMGHDNAYYDSRVWHEAPPLLEDVYTFEDALLVGGMLITLLHHADRVKIACMAQLVNVIAPIMTRKNGGAWVQTIYWPLMQASLYGRGTSLMPIIESPAFATADFDAVPMVEAAAVQHEDGSVTVFALNRDEGEDVALSLDLRAFEGLNLRGHSVLACEDMLAVNTEEDPDRVKPADRPVNPDDETVLLPHRSWNVIQLGKCDGNAAK